MSFFNSPLLLGFDQFERTLDRITKAGAEGYPPYNVEQVGEDHLRITLAVAGFSAEDLEIEIEDNQLTVRGHQKDEPERVYLHRGIATRQFRRSFVLAEGIEVASANLDNGLLAIDMRRVKTNPKVRSIPISKAARTAAPGTIEIEPGK
jgi:HSP20 family molecular chaperone IbpA